MKIQFKVVINTAIGNGKYLIQLFTDQAIIDFSGDKSLEFQVDSNTSSNIYVGDIHEIDLCKPVRRK